MLLRSAIALLLAVTTVLPGVAEQPAAAPASQTNDIVYSTEIATSHVDWATKLLSGPIRGFFIPSVEYGRDMAELMQRLDLQATTVSVDRQWEINSWGIGDYCGPWLPRGDHNDFRPVYSRVEQALTGPAEFEVMVIPGLNGWSRMSRPARDAIRRRVSAGAGLVLIHPYVGDVKNHPFAGDEPDGDSRIWELSPLVGCPDDTIDALGNPQLNTDAIATGKWEITQSHFITDGLPLDLMPEGTAGGRFYKYQAAGDILIRSGQYPVLAVKHYGKGRVVALGYVEQGFLPEPCDSGATHTGWDYWEYQYALLIRSITWAARRESSFKVEAFDITSGEVQLTLWAPSAKEVVLTFAGQSQFGESIASYSESRSLAPGQNVFRVPIHAVIPSGKWPPGRSILNVVVRDLQTEASLTWAAATHAEAGAATLVSLEPDKSVYQHEDTVRTAVRSEGSIGGLSVRLAVLDDLGRVLTQITKPAATKVAFEYSLQDFIGSQLLLTAELVTGEGQRRLIRRTWQRARWYNPYRRPGGRPGGSHGPRAWLGAPAAGGSGRRLRCEHGR